MHQRSQWAPFSATNLLEDNRWKESSLNSTTDLSSEYSTPLNNSNTWYSRWPLSGRSWLLSKRNSTRRCKTEKKRGMSVRWRTTKKIFPTLKLPTLLIIRENRRKRRNWQGRSGQQVAKAVHQLNLKPKKKPRFNLPPLLLKLNQRNRQDLLQSIRRKSRRRSSLSNRYPLAKPMRRSPTPRRKSNYSPPQLYA